MSRTNLVRFLLTLAALVWAVASMTPFSDTPYEDYLLERVTERSDENGEVMLARGENVEEFKSLLERARNRVESGSDASEGAPPTVYVALLEIADDEGLDLAAQYFEDLRIRDLANLRRKNEIVLNALRQDSRATLQPGLDLAGGISITFEIPEEQLQTTGLNRQEELRDARAVLVGRIDALGVAEPAVRIRGTNQIEVQMPGVDTQTNPDIAEVIGAPALLEFKLVHPTQRPFPGAPTPLGYEVATLEYEDPRTGETSQEQLFLRRIPVMRGDDIARAIPQMGQTGGFRVGIEFTSEGARRFAEVTEQIAASGNQNQPGRLAIVLDGKLISAPTVREKIAGGNAEISGSFTQRQAFNLANALNNPLSVQLEIAEMYEVGATLANEAQSSSVRAALVGSGLVALFMIVWYGLSGVIAMITVAANILLVLGALAAVGATITLPGVAALVLTVGMAVDACILIFERIREELKIGKQMGHALTDGYSKVFSTIVDANVTTLITALVLIYFGTGPVQGFGVTLSIGIVATVFTALVMSRWMLDLAVRFSVIKGLPQRFSFLDRSATPFMDFAKRAFTISWALVALGVVGIWAHWDTLFGIDFLGGDEITVTYTDTFSAEQVRTVAEEGDFGEVNTTFQTPLGGGEPFLSIQTTEGRGPDFYQALSTAYPEAGLELIGSTQIGGSVGAEVRTGAIWAISISLLAILFYIAVRFEIGYGIGALVSTVHDVVLTVGLYVALGEFLGLGSAQFTAPMIAAVLMVIGYSLNDTIVVFDRIREELELNPGMNLKKVIHLAINRTLSRTMLTSVTTLAASLALYLFGAGVIVDFALVFLIGIVVGTFSSIFIASPIFFRYHKGDRKSVERGEILPSYDWSTESEGGKKA